MLVDGSYHLCGWGNIDLPNKKVNGYVGMPSDVLTNLFGLKLTDNTYTIPVKVSGRFDNIKLDSKNALAMIGNIILAEKSNLPIMPKSVVRVPKQTYPIP